MMNDLYIYKISVLCSFQCSFLNLLVFFVSAFVAASSIRYSRTQIRSVCWYAPRLTRKILRNNIYTLEDFVRIFSSANFIIIACISISVNIFLIYFQKIFPTKFVWRFILKFSQIFYYHLLLAFHNIKTFLWCQYFLRIFSCNNIFFIVHNSFINSTL